MVRDHLHLDVLEVVHRRCSEQGLFSIHDFLARSCTFAAQFATVVIADTTLPTSPPSPPQNRPNGIDEPQSTHPRVARPRVAAPRVECSARRRNRCSRHRWGRDRRRNRSRCREPRPVDRGRGGAGLGRGYVEPLQQTGAWRSALPSDARLQTGDGGSAEGSSAHRARPSPRAPDSLPVPVKASSVGTGVRGSRHCPLRHPGKPPARAPGAALAPSSLASAGLGRNPRPSRNRRGWGDRVLGCDCRRCPLRGHGRAHGCRPRCLCRVSHPDRRSHEERGRGCRRRRRVRPRNRPHVPGASAHGHQLDRSLDRGVASFGRRPRWSSCAGVKGHPHRGAEGPDSRLGRSDPADLDERSVRHPVVAVLGDRHNRHGLDRRADQSGRELGRHRLRARSSQRGARPPAESGRRDRHLGGAAPAAPARNDRRHSICQGLA